jgi:hypothetical protein
MKLSAPRARMVSGVAAIAVTLAALGAMASAWFERHDAARELAASTVRPAADAPVRVVRAPEAKPARQYPVACRGCAPAPASGSRL